MGVSLAIELRACVAYLVRFWAGRWGGVGGAIDWRGVG